MYRLRVPPMTAFSCKSLTAIQAALLAASLAAPAQSLPKLDDPANLAGERVSAPDLADTLPINHGAPALEQLLRKLRTRASFMLIVAHPDDEDGGMLTYLSRGQGARVAMLTLTRGEGGQNLMSGDFEDALGLIRTQELLAADRYMGVDQFFGTEVDFGFSKTKEEAFSKWTHERVLYDAVRAVRLYRPLVIGSVFIGAATDGHGQHQVSGEIAQEVFKAAGDPKVFPDQIAQGLQPWQPLKVYARIPFARIDTQGMFDYATNQYAAPRFENYVTGKVANTLPPANVMVAEGTPDALLGGLSYVQFARQGLSLQKTQIGPGVRTAPAGRADVRYHRYGSRVLIDGKPQPDDGDDAVESGFFNGIDISLPGIATLAPEVESKFRPPLAKIDAEIADAQARFDPAHMDAIAPQLRSALAAVDEFIKELDNSSVNDLPVDESYNLLHELRIKRVQLNNALILAHGITIEAHLDSRSPTLLAGSGPFYADVSITGVPKEPNGTLKTIASGVSADAATRNLLFNRDESGANLTNTFAVSLQNAKATRPYFSRPDIEQPYYDVSQRELRNAPGTPSPLTAWATLNDEGVELRIEGHVSESGEGVAKRPAVYVPAVSVSLSHSVSIIARSQNSLRVETQIQSLTAGHDEPTVVLSRGSSSSMPEQGTIRIRVPDKWQVNPLASGWKLTAGQLTAIPFTITTPPASKREIGKIVAESSSDNTGMPGPYAEGFRPVGYPGIVSTNYYTPATLRVVPVDVTTAPNLNVAYLAGTGDDVASALGDLGVTTRTITVADLTPDKLKQYDAVVLGVRAYEAHRELIAANDTLNAYAAAGGVVIAQYNTRLPAGAGPYTLTLDHTENVVDETTPVAILDAVDPLLTWPNKITTADFSGWVEERGHGFMSSWDPHFKPLLESHDPGQPPQQGGLLVARTGKGAWIYLAYALYRQLPEGVPGPYRLLANLISAGKDPAGR